MDDHIIVDMFWDRNEEAIGIAQTQYHTYCMSISYSILGSAQDAEECVNDTFLRAWDSIPPKRPSVLYAYLGKLVRNLSIDRLRAKNAEKRDNRYSVALEEIEYWLSGEEPSEQSYDEILLAEQISTFLRTLSKSRRVLFIGRYWNLLSVTELAEQFGMSEGAVKNSLWRTRTKLKEFLIKEGYQL